MGWNQGTLGYLAVWIRWGLFQLAINLQGTVFLESYVGDVWVFGVRKAIKSLYENSDLLKGVKWSSTFKSNLCVKLNRLCIASLNIICCAATFYLCQARMRGHALPICGHFEFCNGTSICLRTLVICLYDEILGLIYILGCVILGMGLSKIHATFIQSRPASTTMEKLLFVGPLGTLWANGMCNRCSHVKFMLGICATGRISGCNYEISTIVNFYLWIQSTGCRYLTYVWIRDFVSCWAKCRVCCSK